jgi:hypothetical protein
MNMGQKPFMSKDLQNMSGEVEVLWKVAIDCFSFIRSRTFHLNFMLAAYCAHPSIQWHYSPNQALASSVDVP